MNADAYEDEYEAPPWIGTIRCGKCHGRHHAPAQVRACYAETGCSWLISVGRDEDGGEVVIECGYPTTFDARGWRCEAGHEHVRDEVRSREGWAYAEDAAEARSLTKYGTEPRDLVTGGPFRWDA